MRLSSIFTFLATAFALLVFATGASAACTATPTATGTATYSPNAVTPATPSMGAGFGCANGSPLIISFSGNYLKATITTSNGYKLSQSGAPDINYVLSVDAAGTKPLSGSATYFINGTTDVAGLVGLAPASVPVYIKPTISGAVKSGVYTGSFTILWDWSFCSLALGSCIGVTDKDTKSSVVTVNLTISGGKPATVTTTTTVLSDDKNGVTNPKSIPGAKQRTTVTVSNPDTSALASNTMELKIPTPANTSIALDGDGAGGGAFAIFTEGSPASGLAFSYVSATNLGDDVEFSSDGGASWLFLPTAATQSQVTHVRLKPRGAMAAGSNFKISLSYVVK